MREKELLDNIVKIFLDLIRRMTNRSESSIEKEVVKNVRKIYGKTNILRKLIFAITDNPEGKIRDVILPKVDLRLLLDLKKEFSSEDEKEDYHTEKTKKMKSKYSRHYRQMIKPILDEIDFRTNNSSWDDVLIGVDIIHKYIDTKYIYYPEEEDIPTDLINLKWKKLVYGKDKEGNTRVRKHFFELCVLEKFEKLLKCREIYVYGSLKYRNPVDNLPNDWDRDKEEYYKQILDIYAKRWSCEVDYLYLKCFLGIGDFQLRNYEGICSFYFFNILSLNYLQWRKIGSKKPISDMIRLYKEERHKLLIHLIYDAFTSGCSENEVLKMFSR